MKSAVLYALKFSDGVVKVGITSSPRKRMISLRCTNFKNTRLESFAYTPRMDVASNRVEKVMLEKMRAVYVLAKGQEAFFCNDFAAVVTLMRQVFRLFFDAISGWRVFTGLGGPRNKDSGAIQRRDKSGRWAVGVDFFGSASQSRTSACAGHAQAYRCQIPAFACRA